MSLSSRNRTRNGPVVLVDYDFKYHVSFTAINAFKHINKNLDDVDFSENERFLNIFLKKSIEHLRKIRYKYKTVYSKIFMVQDNPLNTLWRKKLYPEYKANRSSGTRYQGKRFNFGNLFIKFNNDILPKLIEMTQHQLNVVKINGAEADDVIAILTRKIPSYIDVYIISSDTDFLQLLDRRYTYIYTQKGEYNNKKLGNKSAKYKLLEKILSGDKSDNIPSCFGREYGRTRDELIEKCLNSTDFLNNLLDIDQKFKEQYELNRTLIDFDYIPQDIQDDILTECDVAIGKCY